MSNNKSNIEWAKGMLDELEFGKDRDWREDFDNCFDRLREIYGEGPPSGWIEEQALKMVILLDGIKGEFNFNIEIDSPGDEGPSKEVITINY